MGGNPVSFSDSKGLLLDTTGAYAVAEAVATATGVATATVLAPILGVAAAVTPSSLGNGDLYDEKCPDDGCRKASDAELKEHNIDGHEFKRGLLGKKAPIKKYDICFCKDGTIKIKAQGACGKPGPSIDTYEVWK